MVPVRTLQRASLAAGLVSLAQVCLSVIWVAQPAWADTTTVIMQGNVVMPDGSPPPKTVGLEKVCSDYQGSAPGPIADKKGHYLWRQELDFTNTRVCFMRANLPGFTSTRIDISNMDLSNFAGGTKEMNMPDLVLSPRDNGEGNQTSLIPADDAPGKAQVPYKAAMKALDARNQEEGIRQLQLAVKAVPKFADGWTILGALYEQQQMLMEARDALQHAIEANPKFVSPYLRLARVSNKLGDWDAATKNEDTLLKMEPHYYPEVYLQQAITRLETKNLAGAEESAKTALSMDPKHLHLSRAEYVLGRIAIAKGDLAAAKQHIATYMSLDPTAPDIERIQIQMDTLGNPDAKLLNITLERP